MTTQTTELILNGYDVVAYFTQHKAIKGMARYQTTYHGASYYFSSASDLAVFRQNPAKCVPQRKGHNTMTTTDFYILTRPVQPGQGQKERPRVATRQPSSKRAKVEKEAEARLWKVCAEVASPRLSGFEWTAFLLLGASALGALVCCFSEFFHLLSSGGLDDTVRALLTK